MSARTPSAKRLALAAALAAAALLAWIAARARGFDGEDFAYYYCAGAVANAGASPYEPAAYQECLRGVFRRPNPNISRDSGSAYPPPAIVLFRALAAPPYAASFALWNAALLAASLWLVSRRRARAADMFLLLLWPAFVLTWDYHKIGLVLFALFLAALALIEDGREAPGGALLSLLVFQPQWLAAAGLYLAARRRRRALAAAAGGALVLALASWRAGWALEWLASAAEHAQTIVGFDNQSLFVALVKPFDAAAWFFPRSWMALTARALVSLALAAEAWRRARRPDGLAPFLGFIVLAQPYSHASDALWAFPLLPAARDRLASRLGWSPRAADAAALGFTLLLWYALAAGPGGRGRVDVENREGYLTCALVLVWLVLEHAPPGTRLHKGAA